LGLPEPRPRDAELEQTLLEISRLLRNARLMHKNLEHQKTLAAVTEQSADAIYITGRDSLITSWNTAAEQLFGYPPGDALGKSVHFLVPKDRMAESEERNAQAVAEGCVQSFETVRLRRDGGRIPVEATFYPLRDEKGRTFGMVRVFRDITKRKEVERMKSEFVSLVSHELRTPLTAIQGFAETIFDFWDELKPEQRRHYLTIILSEAERLGKLVTNFLDISRLEAGGVQLRPVLADLPDLTRRAAALFKEHPSKAEFAVEFAPGSEKAWVDEEQLYRVFVNLLSNAVKYSPAGGRIAISGRCAGAEVEVSVTDQGPGIPPESQEHLFQKFYRVGDPVSRKTPGTGLGLAICRNILAAHGGRIWMESPPGRSATFKFAFPREGLKPA
jgi:PAS domain S-box-containing protein